MVDRVKLVIFIATICMALFLAVLSLQYYLGEELVTPLQTHPRIVHIAVLSWAVCWMILVFKLNSPELYKKYLLHSPVEVVFFGALSIASIVSLLLPDSARTLAYFLCLVLPSLRILVWVSEELLGWSHRPTILRRCWARVWSTRSQEISPSVWSIFFAINLALLQLKFQGQDKGPFLTHPIIVNVAGSSFVVMWLLSYIKMKLPRLFPDHIPLGVELFGSILMGSTASLWFPDSVRPLVYFLFLVLPVGTIVYLIFKKLEEEFGETQFWRTSVKAVLCYLKRKPFHPTEQTYILPRWFKLGPL